MKLPKVDIIATGLVAVACVLYLLWLAGSAPPGLSGIRATGLVILALGFAASAMAVVPSFDQLLHGNKIYVSVTSLIGLAAAIGGVLMLVAESEAALAVVVAAMVVLWLIATIHHSLLAKTAPPTPVGTTVWSGVSRSGRQGLGGASGRQCTAIGMGASTNVRHTAASSPSRQ